MISRGKPAAGITLLLGVLVGTGLVILPGIVAPPTSNSTNTTSSSRVPASGFTFGSGSQSNQATGQTPVVTIVGGLAILVGLVLLPAITLSILVRRWTLGRARSRLGSESQ